MSALNETTQLLPLRLSFVHDGAFTAPQGQALGNGSIISAMETNVQLMDIQIRLVHELTALQASVQPATLTLPVAHLQDQSHPLLHMHHVKQPTCSQSI